MTKLSSIFTSWNLYLLDGTWGAELWRWKERADLKHGRNTDLNMSYIFIIYKLSELKSKSVVNGVYNSTFTICFTYRSSCDTYTVSKRQKLIFSKYIILNSGVVMLVCCSQYNSFVFLGSFHVILPAWNHEVIVKNTWLWVSLHMHLKAAKCGHCDLIKQLVSSVN